MPTDRRASTTTRSVAVDSPNRGQLALSAVEAGLGVLLIVAAMGTFALGVPDAGRETADLDAVAADAATVLAGESPRHAGATRLAEVAHSPAVFERERDALLRRVDAVLPDNVLFDVRTPAGTVGSHPPDGVAVGVATVPTKHGDVTIRVWYA